MSKGDEMYFSGCLRVIQYTAGLLIIRKYSIWIFYLTVLLYSAVYIIQKNP